MSILLVELTPEGMLFGADRNLATTLALSDGSREVVLRGQSQRPKVLKWPNREVIVGYVGEAEYRGESADGWLYGFIGRHLWTPLPEMASALRQELDNLMQAGDIAGASVLHLGGFEEVDGSWMPRIYFVRNTGELRSDGTYEVLEGFACSEELSSATYFEGWTATEIRDQVRNQYFSFRQGVDLWVFNVIDHQVRKAMEQIASLRPGNDLGLAPSSLDEYARRLSFQIHAYASYYAAFFPPFEQLVGGGVDVVWARWPTCPPPSGTGAGDLATV